MPVNVGCTVENDPKHKGTYAQQERYYDYECVGPKHQAYAVGCLGAPPPTPTPVEAGLHSVNSMTNCRKQAMAQPLFSKLSTQIARAQPTRVPAAPSPAPCLVKNADRMISLLMEDPLSQKWLYCGNPYEVIIRNNVINRETCECDTNDYECGCTNGFDA